MDFLVNLWNNIKAIFTGESTPAKKTQTSKNASIFKRKGR